jgi:protein MYSM1
MVMEEEDEALARALWAAEQQDGYEDAYDALGAYGAGADSGSDYEGEGSKKRARRRRGGGAKPKASSARERPPPPVDQEPQHQQHPPPPRRVRRDKDVRREAPARAWTDDEEQLFAQGLAAHGRDWPRVAQVVGSRDGRAVASHAQKHFVRLCVRGVALPAKVAESGAGYTLSGKLLDPRSSSARAYGFRVAALRRLEGEALATALRGIAVEHLAEAAGAGGAVVAAAAEGRGDEEPEAEATAAAVAASPPDDGAEDAPVGAFEAAVATVQREQAAAGAAVAQPRRRAVPQPPPPAATASDPDQKQQQQQQPPPPLNKKRNGPGSATPPPPPPETTTTTEPTEYARNRPRREGAGQRHARALAVGATTEALDLVPCLDFLGAPGSGAPLAQPFSVEVSPEALLVADFHAHLSSCEVIGLLGGSWDPEKRALFVRSAVPCRRAAGSEASTSVELCPGSEVEARAELARRGQTAVGWYHSHPVFEPLPSLKDCENQRNYQVLFRACGNGGGGGEAGANGGPASDGNGNNGKVDPPAPPQAVFEPFVGFILSPYDPALAAPRTAVGAFVVRRAPSGKSALPGGLAPFAVRYTVPSSSGGKEGAPPDDDVERALLALLEELRDDVGRTDLAGLWRPFTLLRAGPSGGGAEGPPMTRAAKLQAALVQRSGGGDAGKALADRVLCALEKLWGVDLGLFLGRREDEADEGGVEAS